MVIAPWLEPLRLKQEHRLAASAPQVWSWLRAQESVDGVNIAGALLGELPDSDERCDDRLADALVAPDFRIRLITATSADSETSLVCLSAGGSVAGWLVVDDELYLGDWTQEQRLFGGWVTSEEGGVPLAVPRTWLAVAARFGSGLSSSRRALCDRALDLLEFPDRAVDDMLGQGAMSQTGDQLRLEPLGEMLRDAVGEDALRIRSLWPSAQPHEFSEVLLAGASPSRRVALLPDPQSEDRVQVVPVSVTDLTSILAVLEGTGRP